MPTLTLAETLQRALNAAPPVSLCVAFSGGPDSTALLHALAQMPEARSRRLRALHIDHGLHADSADWARHCAAFCRALDLPLTSIKVAVDDTRHEGLEAAARRARYAAFAETLGTGEWLALAHHRDDQIETVLLKLLRGAGPDGLGGMRILRAFGAGSLWRPLLEIPRVVIANYLFQNNIETINDPSNADRNFTRNWLRHTLLPVIQEHQPHAGAAILHAAELCRAAADHLAMEATAAGATLIDADGTLAAEGWIALPATLRAPVLDAWLHSHDLSAPPDRARAELASQAANAGADRVPTIGWPDAEIRIWRGRLYANSSLPAPPSDWNVPWNGAPLALPAGGGTLLLVPNDATVAPQSALTEPQFTVRVNQSGQRVLMASDGHHHRLSELLRNAGLPPWWRKHCPLIYADGQLLAAGDIAVSAAGQRVFAALGVRPHWLRPGQR